MKYEEEGGEFMGDSRFKFVICMEDSEWYTEGLYIRGNVPHNRPKYLYESPMGDSSRS
jgi:hypothetical protein